MKMNKIFDKGNTLGLVAGGITTCLAGCMLIILGDGHDSLSSKVVVVSGVIITVVGIGFLRYLPFRARN